MSFSFIPVIACEIEFYLHGSQDKDLAAFWEAVKARSAAESVGIFKIEKETGHEQHEVALAPASADKAARDCVLLKEIIAALAPEYDMRADFAAKPFVDQPGSGLHVHIHLEDAGGRNVFFKDDHGISEPLRHALGGLLAHMREDMAIFAPAEVSRLRFLHPDHHTPTTVSWGANNRTAALRLPDSGYYKRIEHRVAGADADPQAVIAAILTAIEDGIVRKLEPGEQIHGDASLAMYGLPRLL